MTKAELIDAISELERDASGDEGWTTVVIPERIALECLKWRRDEAGGDLAQRLFTNGIEALNGERIGFYVARVDKAATALRLE